MEPLQGAELGLWEDPALASVEEHRRHDGLVKHPGDRRGHALLGDNLGEAPPNRPRARQLPARRGDIAAVVSRGM